MISFILAGPLPYYTNEQLSESQPMKTAIGFVCLSSGELPKWAGGGQQGLGLRAWGAEWAGHTGPPQPGA